MGAMSLRRATPDDAAELTRLRATMLKSMNDDISEEQWWRNAEEVFQRRLSAEPETFVAFVVEGPDGTLMSSGVGWISEHLPGPRNPTGRRGHIASMSTVPQARRRGHGRQIIEALLRWFDDHGVTRVDLTATAMGEPLYRSVGFDDHADAVSLVRRLEDQAP